ncbi:hypothetical protein J437_LFUL015548, partial [Ladona fulva]
MDVQRRRLAALQDSAQQLSSGSAAGPTAIPPTDVMEHIEALQDRWDALAEIMSVQGQRMASFPGIGYTISPTVEVSATVVTSGGHWQIRESPLKNQEVSLQGGSKRRRVGPVNSSRLEFDSMVGRLLSWMEHVEGVLVGGGDASPSGDTSKTTISVGSTFDELSVDEQLVLYEDTESEVNAHEANSSAVAKSEHKAFVEEMERKTREVEVRWNDVKALLKDRRERIEFLLGKKNFLNELGALRLVLQGYMKWIQACPSITVESSPSSQQLQSQLEQCRV